MARTSKAEGKVRPSFFEKKEAKKLLLPRPRVVAAARPNGMVQSSKSFLLLFFKKEALPHYAS
jgi:hypothetical protein